jgi:hypothetical protein
VAAAYLAIIWNRLEVLSRIQLMSFIAIFVHQYEAYGFPGGEPAITNMVMQPSNLTDCYPLNQNSAIIGNVYLTDIAYLLPMFLSNVIWFGLVLYYCIKRAAEMRKTYR